MHKAKPKNDKGSQSSRVRVQAGVQASPAQGSRTTLPPRLLGHRLGSRLHQCLAPSAPRPARVPLPRCPSLSAGTWVPLLDKNVDGSVGDWWPSHGRGHYEGRWPEPHANPNPAGIEWGLATPTGGGFLLTCFSSAHSPHHGWHRGHCWSVHPMVLWRLLHVSSHCKPQDWVGGRHCWGQR